jgi:putative transposase
MSTFRRNLVPGGTFFFTCVTHNRRPILTTELGRTCHREAITKVGTDHPFNLLATVLLPDHWHSVWTLPPGDDRYSIRWMRVKEEFTNRWIEKGGAESPQSESRVKQRSGVSGKVVSGNTPSGTRLICNDALTTFIGIRGSTSL